jgi:ribonuclease HI
MVRYVVPQYILLLKTKNTIWSHKIPNKQKEKYRALNKAARKTPHVCFSYVEQRAQAPKNEIIEDEELVSIL